MLTQLLGRLGELIYVKHLGHTVSAMNMSAIIIVVVLSDISGIVMIILMKALQFK